MRRKRSGAAGAAYSHALAVLRRPSEATIIARSALRRGAHSRTAVLAHARHGALERSGDFIPTSTAEPASHDIRELAWQLAGSRPATERSLVDLELRYGLSPAVFAKVLGLSPDRADERSAQVSTNWQASLDTAMMAYLGPGSCPDLSVILSDGGLHQSATLAVADSPAVNDEPDAVVSTAVDSSVRIGALLEVAPAVDAHAGTCSICGERLAQMTSVRTLVGSRPLEAVPAAVVGTAREAKHRVAGPMPPSLEPRRFDLQRLRPVATYVVAMAVIAAVAVMAVDARNNGDSQSERVARLLATQSVSPFLATPSVISGAGAVVTLANNGQEPLQWRVQPTEPWLSVSPRDGEIQAGGTTTVAVAVVTDSAGESSTLRFTTEDDNEQLVRYEIDGG